MAESNPIIIGPEQAQMSVLEAVDTSKDNLEEVAPIRERQRLAEATGIAYSHLIDACLQGATHEDMKQLLLEIPLEARSLFGRGLEMLQTEMGKNSQLLQEHKGNEIEYFLEILADGKEIVDLFGRAPEVTMWEPTPGIPVFWADMKVLKSGLSDHPLIPSDFDVYTNPDEDDKRLSFIIANRYGEQGLDPQNPLQSPATAQRLRHEFHHMIWHFLYRSGFVRPVDEENEAVADCLYLVRHEAAAYLLSMEGPKRLGRTDPKSIAYTRDKELLVEAGRAQNFTYVAAELGKLKGWDVLTFLYPLFVSRTFDELKQNIIDLCPIEDNDGQALDLLLQIFPFNEHGGAAAPGFQNAMEEPIANIVSHYKDHFSPEYLESFLEHRMQMITEELRTTTHPPRSMGDAEHVISFSFDPIRKLIIAPLGLEAKLPNFISLLPPELMPLPEDTIRVILDQPRDTISSVPLGKAGKDFVDSYIDRVFGPSYRPQPFESIERTIPTVRAIINSTEELSEQFNIHRTELIAEWERESEDEGDDYRSEPQSKEGLPVLSKLKELINSI